jgi:hypothetical protein
MNYIKSFNFLMALMTCSFMYSSNGKLYRNLLGPALKAAKVQYVTQNVIAPEFKNNIINHNPNQKYYSEFLANIRNPEIDTKKLDEYKNLIRASQTANIIVDYKNPAIGYGVFALKNIPRGTFIGEYTGKINHLPKNNSNDAYAWPNWVLTKPNSYQVANLEQAMVNVEENLNEYYVDALKYGNELRFVNDNGDKSNCIADTILGHDKLPHLYYIAGKDIKAGSELTVQYGDQYWNQPGRKKLDLPQD